MADDCNTCGGSTETEEMLPVATNTPALDTIVPTTVTTCTTKKVATVCSTIRDECHDCAPDPLPFAKIKLTNAFALPACDHEVEAVFDEDISNLMEGLTLYAVDAAQKTIRLRITKITPDNKLTLKNVCSSCCGSSKPVGETIIADTYFSWGLPDCCAAASGVDADACLVGTFFFPASGATAPANVPNSNIFVLGSLYSMGGFIWKVTARVTTTQILLQNPAPGNGSSVGGYIEGGTDGVCVFPITPISEASECDDSAVDAVSLIGCTASGKKKLTSEKHCSYVRFDHVTGSFSSVDLLGGSTISGPHYVEWDKDNPCLSRLVSAPQLVGTQCGTLKGDLFLTTANVSQEYEIDVSTTVPLYTVAPNNIITLSARQFTVLAIITPSSLGVDGKIRIKPRFTVGGSETIPETTQYCVVEGCQPFPKTDYLLAADLEDNGQPVYCADDGLRVAPPPKSFAGLVGISFPADVGGIEVVGNYDRANVAVTLTNPSNAHSCWVTGQIEVINTLTLNDDGIWFQDILTGVDVAANVLSLSKRIVSQNGQRVLSDSLNLSFIESLAPGQTKTLNIILRIRTTNASADTDLVWSDADGRVAVHMTTTQ